MRLLRGSRIAANDAADLVLETERHGREDVMPRATLDEIVRNRAMSAIVAVVPARRPADDVKLVVVAVSDDVATGLSEASHDVDMARRRGPVHRAGVVPALACVEVETAREEQVHRRQVSLLCGRVQ
jgi:hypothetical protein